MQPLAIIHPQTIAWSNAAQVKFFSLLIAFNYEYTAGKLQIMPGSKAGP